MTQKQGFRDVGQPLDLRDEGGSKTPRNDKNRF
jgi:hypothetical protein